MEKEMGGGRGGGKGTKAGRETETEERVRREKSQLRQFDFNGKAWIRNLFLELASPRDNQGSVFLTWMFTLLLIRLMELLRIQSFLYFPRVLEVSSGG